MIKFFVTLWGESLNEAKQYLEYNAKSIELKVIGISQKADRHNKFLFECRVKEESDLTKLYSLSDVEIFR